MVLVLGYFLTICLVVRQLLSPDLRTFRTRLGAPAIDLQSPLSKYLELLLRLKLAQEQ
jgi:hypothetical protein